MLQMFPTPIDRQLETVLQANLCSKSSRDKQLVAAYPGHGVTGPSSASETNAPDVVTQNLDNCLGQSSNRRALTRTNVEDSLAS